MRLVKFRWIFRKYLTVKLSLYANPVCVWVCVCFKACAPSLPPTPGVIRHSGAGRWKGHLQSVLGLSAWPQCGKDISPELLAVHFPTGRQEVFLSGEGREAVELGRGRMDGEVSQAQDTGGDGTRDCYQILCPFLSWEAQAQIQVTLIRVAIGQHGVRSWSSLTPKETYGCYLC